jgi:hypothetical protein
MYSVLSHPPPPPPQLHLDLGHSQPKGQAPLRRESASEKFKVLFSLREKLPLRATSLGCPHGSPRNTLCSPVQEDPELDSSPR